MNINSEIISVVLLPVHLFAESRATSASRSEWRITKSTLTEVSYALLELVLGCSRPVVIAAVSKKSSPLAVHAVGPASTTSHPTHKYSITSKARETPSIRFYTHR